MQRVRIENICNICKRDEEEEVAADNQYKAAVDGSRQIALDLCDEHNKQTMTVAEALELFLIYGHNIEKPSDPRLSHHAKYPPNFTCDICGMGYQKERYYKDHIENAHNDNPPKYDCKFQDCDFAAKTDQGLVVHKNRMGHWDSIPSGLDNMPTIP